MGIAIAPGLWTDEEQPRLIGGQRLSDGQIVFPMPVGDAGADYTPVPLAREGMLWSWTIQDFEPKRPPYAGPEPFAPFALGYVELPGQVIVEARLADVTSAELAIGMEMELVIIPFTGDRLTFAFRPLERNT